MTTFCLPDLGEGLPEAEIVRWHIAEGDKVIADQPLVSVETAKAIVEVPAPQSGTVHKLHATEGMMVATGAPLVDFAANGGKAASNSTKKLKAAEPAAATVVGNVPTSNALLEENAIAGTARRRGTARIKATPSVRSEARRLGIDLATITATGRNGQITAADLANLADGDNAAASADVKATRTPAGGGEKLRGPWRSMAKSMSENRDQVALCTVFDDADIHAWINKRDFTARILRALASGCSAEPRLNAFYNAELETLQVQSRIDIAMAVDTDDGLIVPVIRAVQSKDLAQLRADVAALKTATMKRAIAPSEMLDYTITLSNFGMLAGRYATPLMVPPTVAILGTGKVQHDVVAVMGGIEVHQRVPLSLSFDHRCVAGGNACRFLAAVVKNLEKPE